MELTFYISGTVAILATVLMLTRLNVVHAQLYLIVSLLAVAVDMYTLGAPFVAALEVIIYAGAIMVLFVFAVMMLNLGGRSAKTEKEWLTPGIWIGPALLASVLLIEVVMLARRAGPAFAVNVIGPQQVGIALFGPYVIGVELASMLLLAGLVGAYHLGFQKVSKVEIRHEPNTDERRADTGGGLVLVGTHQSSGTP
jgi:NADH-quinone oxidoreductase subunit J